MGEKRFRTRSQWNNTRLALYVAPFFLLTGIFTGATTGRYFLLLALGSLMLLALVIGILRDRTARGHYVVAADSLNLERGKDRLVIPAAEIIDASLLDRTAARDYFGSRLMRPGMNRREMGRSFLRFCTVDIGLRTFTFGLGRGLIDRMPDARHDLLLLRLKQGTDVLLSPEYNQDMVESIARLTRRSAEGSKPGSGPDQE